MFCNWVNNFTLVTQSGPKYPLAAVMIDAAATTDGEYVANLKSEKDNQIQ